MRECLLGVNTYLRCLRLSVNLHQPSFHHHLLLQSSQRWELRLPHHLIKQISLLIQTRSYVDHSFLLQVRIRMES